MLTMVHDGHEDTGVDHCDEILKGDDDAKEDGA